MRSFIVCDVDVCCAGLIATKGFFAASFLTITAGNSSETAFTASSSPVILPLSSTVILLLSISLASSFEL